MTLTRRELLAASGTLAMGLSGLSASVHAAAISNTLKPKRLRPGMIGDQQSAMVGQVREREASSWPSLKLGQLQGSFYRCTPTGVRGPPGISWAAVTPLSLAALL